MRSLFSIILLSTITVGCGTFKAKKLINPTFLPYYNLFEEYYNIRPKVPINFSKKLKGTTAGKCNYGSKNESPYITVNKDWWTVLTEDQKINLVFHELGHCLLYRKHENGTLADSCPKSFMNDYLVDLDCLDKYYDHYIDELL